MNIVIFSDTTRPKVDGVVVSTELFINELERLGHKTLLVVPKFPGQEPKPNIYQVDSINFSFIYPMSRLGKFWQTRKLKKRLDEFKPDVVHSMTEFTVGHWMSTLIKRHYDVPRIHTFHTLWNEYFDYFPFAPNSLMLAWMRWVSPRALRKRADVVIAPSPEMRETLQTLWNIGEFPIAVVPTGIEVQRFEHMNGPAFRQKHSIQTDEKVILYLGRMGEEKNVGLVLETMARLKKEASAPPMRFVVAGGGPDGYMKKLRKHAQRLGIDDDIIWTGFVRGQDWLDCYGASDVFLFPSVTETQGLVVVESLAAGVPMVSVKAMGPANTMKGEKGCLWGENDPVDFAEKAMRLLTDENLYAQKVAEAKVVAEKYSIEVRCQDLLEVYSCAREGRELPPSLTPSSKSLGP